MLSIRLYGTEKLRTVKYIQTNAICVSPVFCRAELVSPDRDHLRSGHLQLHCGGPPLPPGPLQEAAQRVADPGGLQGAVPHRGQVTGV